MGSCAERRAASQAPFPRPASHPIHCGPQSAEDGVVEASELPARRRPTPGRSRMPDGGPQSADDGVVEASELPARRAPHPAGAGCRTVCLEEQDKFYN